MTDTLAVQIARRLRARREAMKLSQEELADRMGLNHRQILTAIESGDRRIQPTELVAAARALEVPVDYFTDPYMAAGEAAFSFRAEDVEGEVLKEFEVKAGNWLATYRALCRPSFLKKALALTVDSSYEQAQDSGE
jgi:transcriptional regulator with XRE-family HTH domain